MNTKVMLAPRYNLGVEDFGDQHVLALECMSCGTTSSIPAEIRRQKYKFYDRLKVVEDDFHFDNCGQFGTCHWHVEEIDG
jgi:hypothetical protein